MLLESPAGHCPSLPGEAKGPPFSVYALYGFFSNYVNAAAASISIPFFLTHFWMQ